MVSGSLEKPGEAEITRNNTDAIPEVDVTMDMLLNSPENPEGWLMYLGGMRNQRHMQNSAITPDNVGDLSLEYEMNLGQTPGEYQGAPVVVPGDPPIMYQTNGPDHLRAMNARTGEVLWHYDYQPQVEIGDPPANRGVTVLDGTVYFTTLDLGVIALDRYTGEEQWFFNQAKEYREKSVDNPNTELVEDTVWARNVGFCSGIPPKPYEGSLLKGSFGGEYGVKGWIDSLSMDGEHEWRVNTVPKDQWVGDAWKHGSTTVWQPPAIDPDTGVAVFPMGNPGPDFDATVRPGWNPYSTGKLALDAETGEYQWHYQESPHDWWDYDSPSPAFIFEAEARGEQRTLASWPGKTGWLFTFDVETGEMITRSEGYVDHVNMWELPRHEDLDAMPWSAPNLLGGTDPQPPAYDPTTRTAIVKGDNRPWKLTWTDAEFEAGSQYWALAGLELPPPEDAEIDGWNGNNGVIAGVDPVTGEIKWSNWRDLTPWGTAMTTDTGITFVGASNGEFLALDTETGEELWSYDMGVGVGGAPASWYDPAEGKQYVAVQGGGEGPLGGFGEQGDVFAVFSVETSMDVSDGDGGGGGGGGSDSGDGGDGSDGSDGSDGGGDGDGGDGSDGSDSSDGGGDGDGGDGGGGGTETPGGSGPGLGILSALAGLGGAGGYALSRDGDADDEE
jgi:alcohol dehydrogenase (cytochrome c)